MHKIKYLFTASLLLLLTPACEKEIIEPVMVVPPEPAPPPEPAGPPEPVVTYDIVGGYVQKGPFLNGTAMTLAELDSLLVPTGKTYTTQLLDNQGTYAVRNVSLESQYVQVQASGFYYNEVTDANSSGQLTLFALSDLSERNSLNVNLLSSLEKARIEYLLAEGVAFAAAKARAQREILAVFEIDAAGMTASELLDITQAGEGNAILLAVSLILQGYQEVADLSELLGNMSTDLRQDGVVNSQSVGSTLVNNAVALDPEAIRANLIARYEAMGVTVSIPDFGPYVKHFLDHTKFTFTNSIKYPENGAYGKNVLLTGDTIYSRDAYSLAAELPAPYQSLRVDISGPGWMFNSIQPDRGWEFGSLGPNTARTFTTTRTGKVDFELQFTRQWSPAPPSVPVPSPLQPCYSDQGNPYPEMDTVQELPPYPCLIGLDTIFPPTMPVEEPGPPEPIPTIRIAVYENGSEDALWVKEIIVL
ncbi:hypothetical protein CLV84_0685 [Neolewinella xylanilytica]|uniref:Uncharacterized protein n=1 Tax=Neolewinella xylanilytica TaxID=1514080 RepID=A0A2S6I8B3_9BACT|nr:hypothetical protein [Neolewinella xylanilytica]PPK87735.1 hypothetical protein CLV84_0685 [Neolewinella xylanilytica]